MTVDISKYEELLQRFGGISDNHIRGEALDNLKEKYRDEIHSKRSLEAIVSVSSLLQVLKKRGVLQYNDINALRDINQDCVSDESIKQQIEDLIRQYSEWLDRNSGSIKFLYSSGKSNPLLTSHENVPETLIEVPETPYLHNINVDENLETSTEDMTKENLLKNGSLIIFNNMSRSKNETNRNSFYIINLCSLKIHKKMVTTVLMILILIFILIGIIWILFKLPRESAVVLPEDLSTPAASGQSQSNMPFYMASTTVGYSTQSTFSANHQQFYSTSTVPPVNREYELRQEVVRELSKRIGQYWKDVCRGLDISENTIDEITMKYSQEPVGQKYMKMFKQGMTIYFSEPRPQWKTELLKALKAAKRIDLQERAQEIIHNYSNL